MKNSFIALILFLLLCFTAGAALADCTNYVIDLDANQNKGQILYRTNCLASCHLSTSAQPLTSGSKQQGEWKAIAENLSAIPCIKDWPQELTEEDVSNIFSYFYARASDSPLFSS